MNIDRSNYEIWFIDFLDGNLDEQKTELLYLFLNDNPDLRDEFTDLGIANINPAPVSFRNKEHLKKSPSEIPAAQFDYLCAGYLENDLSAEQQSELMEIINKNPEKGKSFGLILKTRLVPYTLKYRNKHLLYRKTLSQKIIRLSVIGLSAAAAITLIISTYLSVPEKIPDINNAEAVVIIPGSNLQPQSPDMASDIVPFSDNKMAETVKIKDKNPGIKNIIQTPLLIADLVENNMQEDSVIRNNNVAGIQKISVNEFSGLVQSKGSYNLAASSIYFKESEPEDGRSNIGKYIAKTFREKFLKEKTPPDSPLKGYEIAEAGVSGINKLFGWEMALDKKNDKNGELKSVYFSSRIIKFNAPVKKSEPLP